MRVIPILSEIGHVSLLVTTVRNVPQSELKLPQLSFSRLSH